MANMRLVRVRVTNFKCALDSEWFSVGDLTCLVGKNESGKTAILEALEKINSVDPARRSFSDTEYPRVLWSEYQAGDKIDVAVETAWTLDSQEVLDLNEIAGVEAFSSGHEVLLTKDYANRRRWSLNVELRPVVQSLVANSGLTATEKKSLEKAPTTNELTARLAKLEAPSERQAAFRTELATRFPEGSFTAQATHHLDRCLPHFLYYSQYDRLPGQVAVDELVAAQESGTLDRLQGYKVFIALLAMVGTTPEEIRTITTSEHLIAQLEAVENRLSAKIFQYWTQNKHLEVNFRFDEASPQDPAPFNTGKIFRTRIRNKRHRATIGLDERSTGFIWFFSFLVWFSEVQREFGDKLIVLLDEPGLTLHARAQADLLRYMKTELVPKYQLLYTTHSPFMIDSGDLLSCRTVEDATGPDESILGTKVGDDVLSTDADTVFPLQAALGFDLTQTLFVGEHCLLVEGPSDLLYFQYFSNLLGNAGREGLDARWTITPCGGITKVSSFMALFGGSRLHVAIVTDYGDGDKRKVRDLRESDLLRDGHVLSADMFVSENEADTEDIVGRENYLAIVSSAYGLSGKQRLPATRPAGAPVRVVAEVEAHFRTLPPAVAEFDHFRPARSLVQGADDALLPDADGALDRFEQLFKTLNALL